MLLGLLLPFQSPAVAVGVSVRFAVQIRGIRVPTLYPMQLGSSLAYRLSAASIFGSARTRSLSSSSRGTTAPAATRRDTTS